MGRAAIRGRSAPSSLDVPAEDDDLLAQFRDLGAHRCQLDATVVLAGGTSRPIRGPHEASRSWRRTASRAGCR